MDNNIIDRDMEDEDFGKILDEYEKDNTLKSGIIKATIVEIKDDFVLLDINKKTEKRMPVSEITDRDGKLMFGVNDTLQVLSFNNKLSHRKFIEKNKITAFAEELAKNESDANFKVKVIAKNKGGYVVEYDGMSFFMPRSLAILKSQEDNIGKIIDVKFKKYDKEESSVIVTRKHFLDSRSEESEAKANVLIENKNVISCKIEKIKNYGLFVSVDGISGIIRYNELSLRGNMNPESNFKEDDLIDAVAINYDKKRRVIEMSVKPLLDDPWDNIDEHISLDSVVKCKVVCIKPYGAFVKILGQDLDALLHISEISWSRNIKNVEDKISLGDELDLKIIEINKETKQIKCSLKQLGTKPFSEFVEKYEAGDILKGKVVHITSFGAFIDVGLLDCILLNINCSWNKGDTCKKIFKTGEEVEVQIETIDKDSDKVYVSRKKLLDSPSDLFMQKYKVGSLVKGAITNIKDFGVFINIENILDALVPKLEIPKEMYDKLQVGGELEARIIRIDKNDSKVKASVTKINEEVEEKELKSYETEERITIGNTARITNKTK